jgi:hypothetical protein
MAKKKKKLKRKKAPVRFRDNMVVEKISNHKLLKDAQKS